MADRHQQPDQRGLSAEQLADERADDLPNREAMSVLGIGGITGPLPLPVDTTDPVTPVPGELPPGVPPTPPTPPVIPLPPTSELSPEDAATLASVAQDIRELNGELNADVHDILDMDVNDLTGDAETSPAETTA